ncbi:hypothetical protein QCM77_45425 [Bradyrhizobium sp. SSUT18]|uniref:hypothetical protein n=1 Tax=Bradyrhizobium sp. SSUT18 TaxID=3040602 RepID=UPI00244CD9B1|nr:hypothetical protein [Bradyrhizobium sp. SSUT18]MDH2407009.1 hypothetical protein [Bradyrhizobium sp. SSUT18]
MRGTIRRVADAAGLDQATVRRAVEAAGLDPKTISFEEGLNLARSIADPARVIGHAANGRGEGGHHTVTDTLAEAKAHAERLRARKIELLNAKLEGSLIPREAVTATGARILAEARTALLSLGHRLAAKVARKTDAREIAHIVQSEVRDVLGALANDDRFFAQLEAEALS